MTNHPGLVVLLKEGESIEQLKSLKKEQLLLRWFNYHLNKSGYNGPEVKNFGSDVRDSVAYTYLLSQIQPKDLRPPVSLDPLQV